MVLRKRGLSRLVKKTGPMGHNPRSIPFRCRGICSRRSSCISGMGKWSYRLPHASLSLPTPPLPRRCRSSWFPSCHPVHSGPVYEQVALGVIHVGRVSVVKRVFLVAVNLRVQISAVLLDVFLAYLELARNLCRCCQIPPCCNSLPCNPFSIMV